MTVRFRYLTLSHNWHGNVALFPIYSLRGAAVQTQIELARNNLEAINHWLDKSDLFLDDKLSYRREQEYLTLARVCIAQGREDPKGPFLSNALHLLERLLADAEAKARMSSILDNSYPAISSAFYTGRECTGAHNARTGAHTCCTGGIHTTLR